ncbi:heterocyst development glycosyltransferase HepC [Nostoc sp. C117]|uniref:heterocyst development glycosyltransferase HepC n=1 Tax=Nostoc sp. C117 TaxID=3349875 RepID=UPI00370D23B2
MTSSIIPTLENFYDLTQPHRDNHSGYCTLQWRRGKLLVKSPGQVKLPYLPLLNSERSLVECLKRSPVSLVSIDPKLGEGLLQFWADACEQADKPIFLRIPVSNKLPKQGNQTFRLLQRVIDWMIALVLLLLLSPVILVLIVLMQIYSPESVFCHEWHVGERGRLFRAIKFSRTAKHNIIPLAAWMHKYNLDNLSLLFNVLRGDISLMGSRSWTLTDAIELSSQGQLVEEEFRMGYAPLR